MSGDGVRRVYQPSLDELYIRLTQRARQEQTLDVGMHASNVRERLNSGIHLFSASWIQRKPLLLFVLDGLFLLRLAQRMLFTLLFHEPPRTTRCFEPAPFFETDIVQNFSAYLISVAKAGVP